MSAQLAHERAVALYRFLSGGVLPLWVAGDPPLGMAYLAAVNAERERYLKLARRVGSETINSLTNDAIETPANQP